MDIELTKLKTKQAKKGKLVEFLSAKDVRRHAGKFGHLFFVTFDNKRAIRGNHYHKKHHEYYIALSGKIKVILKDLKSNKKKTIILDSKNNSYKRLRIGPNIAHLAHSLTPKATLLAYYGDPYSPKSLDTYPYKLIDNKS